MVALGINNNKLIFQMQNDERTPTITMVTKIIACAA